VRRLLRPFGTVLIVVGLLAVVWAGVVWAWRDPFTSLYTTYEQHRLSSRLDERMQQFSLRLRPDTPAAGEGTGQTAAARRKQLADDARRFGSETGQGDAIGRLIVPRLGLRSVVVNGTDSASLRKGPGRYLGSTMPGQGGLVYIAGHRTTYLAPFSHIDDMRPGDPVTIEMPYGTFRYRVTGHQIVAATDLSVLRSRTRELLALQACHPRFFATQRYIVWARLVRESSVQTDSTLAAAG